MAGRCWPQSQEELLEAGTAEMHVPAIGSFFLPEVRLLPLLQLASGPERQIFVAAVSKKVSE